VPLVEPCCPAQSVCHITVTSDVRANIKYIYRLWYSRKARHSSAVLIVISSKSVSICNRSHARQANGGKITILGVPLFDALVRGESLHPAQQICSQETRDSTLSHGKNPESLSNLGLVW